MKPGPQYRAPLSSVGSQEKACILSSYIQAPLNLSPVYTSQSQWRINQRIIIFQHFLSPSNPWVPYRRITGCRRPPCTQLNRLIGKKEKRCKPFFPGFRFLESIDKGERQREKVTATWENFQWSSASVWLINVLEGNLSGISPPLLDDGGMGKKTWQPVPTCWNHKLQLMRWNIAGASLVAQPAKNLPGMQETRVQSLGREDSLEKRMATHSSILVWEIPWTEEPHGLQFTG